MAEMQHGLLGPAVVSEKNFGRPPVQRGLPAAVKVLKRDGVMLSKEERKAIKPVEGELIMRWIPDPPARELRSVATLELILDECSSQRLLTIYNVTLERMDGGGVTLRGHEARRAGLPERQLFDQVWLVTFPGVMLPRLGK